MNQIYCLCTIGKGKNWNTFYEESCELFSFLSVPITHFHCDSDAYHPRNVVPATEIRIKHLQCAIDENAKFKNMGIYSAPNFSEEDGVWIYNAADLFIGFSHSDEDDEISVNMTEQLYKKLKEDCFLSFAENFINDGRGELYTVDVDIAEKETWQQSLPQNYNFNHIRRGTTPPEPCRAVKVIKKLG